MTSPDRTTTTTTNVVSHDELHPGVPGFQPGRRRVIGWGLGGLAGLAGLGSGCGGGAGIGGTGDTAGAYSAGSISGFGSVIVNGVRFDDGAARVEDEAGALRGAADLRLGMTAAIDSGPITRDASGALVATARTIRFASELLGPVTRVDAATASLVVLGLTVRLSVATVIDDRLSGGLAAITVGQVIEVYGYFDGTAVVATRIEPATGLVVYRVRGVVAALDTAARTLRIGTQAYSYAGATAVPNNLAVGSYVRVLLGSTPVSGAIPITAFRGASSAPDDATEAKVEGRITRFASTTSFSVDGQPVDAVGALITGIGLALGVRVEVEGALRSGVLRATQVKVETEDEVKNSGVDLKGPITQIDRALRRFVVRGSTVNYAVAGIRYDNGVEADLAVGRQVEVRGTLSTERTTVEASRIKFV